MLLTATHPREQCTSFTACQRALDRSGPECQRCSASCRALLRLSVALAFVVVTVARIRVGIRAFARLVRRPLLLPLLGLGALFAPALALALAVVLRFATVLGGV